ncbi:hypothetical protein NI17_000855 [Thermobifida halotolerans]|uniref:Uncharacterized protein n=1 Tax=Thermobifida halotolerans TaxID=483545 RepID=A0A399G4M5_9ACTN|nr:hypothetical protein [Thermobifida halotolerans]UOE19848.1 hypothetical protein NI17_000855 [Thermobifida halotolerans]
MPAGALVVSQAVVLAALAVVGAATMLGLAHVGFGLAAPESAAGVAVGFVLGVCAFAGTGVLLGSVLPSPRAARGAGLPLFFGAATCASPGTDRMR